jgi:opacity protein-like surface antigen
VFAGTEMKKLLLTTTSIVAFSAHMQLSRAADIGAVGNVGFPITYISFEGSVMFDASPSNMSFDEDDWKLGDLDSLQPGDWGGFGRFELGQRLSSEWDYKVGVAAVFLGEDSSSDDDAEASQKTSLQTLDVEIGYFPNDIGALQTRIFGGLRGLHSASKADWFHDGPDRIGEFDDEVYAIGPRIGVDLLLPLNSTDISLVGSASGSVLLGNTESSYNYYRVSSELTRWSDSETIWNVEVMAGVALDIDENAALTLGYRAAQFGGLVDERSHIQSDGDFDKGGTSDLLVHGPFARLTIEIP